MSVLTKEIEKEIDNMEDRFLEILDIIFLSFLILTGLYFMLKGIMFYMF